MKRAPLYDWEVETYGDGNNVSSKKTKKNVDNREKPKDVSNDFKKIREELREEFNKEWEKNIKKIMEELEDYEGLEFEIKYFKKMEELNGDEKTLKRIRKLEEIIEFKNESKYKKNNPYTKYNKYKIPKPISKEKNYRDGLNRQCSIYGVRIVDLIARNKEEEEIYDELNTSLAKNTHNRTWHLLKDALKKYPDNPIFLYYKALELYRTKNFDYADSCIYSALSNAKKYGLSDDFMSGCCGLIIFEEVRNNIYKRKVKKRPGRPRYKNSKF